MDSFSAISSPVRRYSRRSRSIETSQGSPVRFATSLGREERFSSPAGPSFSNRASHLRAVLSLIAKRSDDRQRLAFLYPPNHFRSTKRRHSRILMGVVHP
jgi:hypothetical protein